MNKQDFSFTLPEELIAQFPLANRSDSRLLHYDRATESANHLKFSDIVNLLQPNDLLVLNNTKVMSARLFGMKSTGGKIELLVERVLEPHRFVAQIKASKALKTGSEFIIGDEVRLQIIGRREAMYDCKICSSLSVVELLETYGQIPLPPYIERGVTDADSERYQTVFAKHDGAVAAPTAGLHFDKPLLDKLQAKGVNIDYLTLHVGAGTFQPVRVDDIESHTMHSEWLSCNQSLVDNILQTKAKGGRVIAVGTTVVRALETAALSGSLQPYEGDTNIFLYPGKPFRVIDGMVTNFHLPESTLVMLVAAFIGLKETQELYQTAIAERYRFFSYGDSSLLL